MRNSTPLVALIVSLMVLFNVTRIVVVFPFFLLWSLLVVIAKEIGKCCLYTYCEIVVFTKMPAYMLVDYNNGKLQSFEHYVKKAMGTIGKKAE